MLATWPRTSGALRVFSETCQSAPCASVTNAITTMASRLDANDAKVRMDFNQPQVGDLLRKPRATSANSDLLVLVPAYDLFLAVCCSKTACCVHRSFIADWSGPAPEPADWPQEAAR